MMGCGGIADRLEQLGAPCLAFLSTQTPRQQAAPIAAAESPP